MTIYNSAFMGTRLYPKTTNPSKLERLALVLPGTARLVPFKKELEKSFLKMREGATYTDEDGIECPVDVEYEFHSLFSGSAVDTYEGFLLFGWGKFDLDLVPSDQDRYDGSTDDPEIMYQMLWSSAWQDPDGFYDCEGLKSYPFKPGIPGNREIITELSEGFYWA